MIKKNRFEKYKIVEMEIVGKKTYLVEKIDKILARKIYGLGSYIPWDTVHVSGMYCTTISGL